MQDHLLNLINYFKRKEWANIFTIYLRYLIGGAFVFASVVKMEGGRFYGTDGTDFPINSMPHFFETLYQSGLYWQFLGFSQLFAGCILMTQRFALIGAMLFLPIIANIFVITVAYHFTGTPFITGAMLLANIYLTLWNYDRLIPLFSDSFKKPFDNPVEKLPVWIVTGVTIFISTLLFRFYGSSFAIWYGLCVTEGLLGFIYFKIASRKSKAAL